MEFNFNLKSINQYQLPLLLVDILQCDSGEMMVV